MASFTHDIFLHRFIVTSQSNARHGHSLPDFLTLTLNPGCETMDSGGMTKMLPWEQQLIRQSI